MSHLEELKYIVPRIVVGELGVKNLEVHIVHVFGDQTGDFRAGVSYNVEERKDIRSTGQVLENFDLALYLLFLDWFQDFDDARLLRYDVYAFKYL